MAPVSVWEHNMHLRPVKLFFTACSGQILPHALKSIFSDAGVNRNCVPCANCSAGLSGPQVHLPLSKSSTDRGQNQLLRW